MGTNIQCRCKVALSYQCLCIKRVQARAGLSQAPCDTSARGPSRIGFFDVRHTRASILSPVYSCFCVRGSIASSASLFIQFIHPLGTDGHPKEVPVLLFVTPSRGCDSCDVGRKCADANHHFRSSTFSLPAPLCVSL